MKTAHIYIQNNNREESHLVRIIDAMPIPGHEYLDTHANVVTVELLRAYIDSSDSTIENGSVYRIMAEDDDGDRFEELVLVPADMTMTAEEFVQTVIDGDREGITHMTEEDAAATLNVFRRDDYDHLIPDDLTAAEFARIWNEIKGE